MRAHLHQDKEGGVSEKWEFWGRDHYIGDKGLQYSLILQKKIMKKGYDEKEVVTNLFFTVAYTQV